jgi:hypothetical protein
VQVQAPTNEDQFLQESVENTLARMAPNSTTQPDMVQANREFDAVDIYCLRDEVKGKYNQPYFPEMQADEQSLKNAIRVMVG